MPYTRKHQTLTSFGKASMALAKLLREEGEKFDSDDATFIENHILLVELAYSTWKHGPQKTRSTQSRIDAPPSGDSDTPTA